MNTMPSAAPHSRTLNWRSPTIHEIAAASGVGTATVDRVLNGREGVRESTRLRVMQAVEKFSKPEASVPARHWRIAFLSEAGPSFNQTLEAAILRYGNNNPGSAYSFTGWASSRADTIKFANLIERTAEECDGLVIVAREDLTINRAIRNVIARKNPVICLNTDLPASGRAVFVGSDQIAAGSTAACLMGRTLGNRAGKILLVYSLPYRAQEERELGFRRVLRSEFSQLQIDDRVNSNDDNEHSYRHVMNYIESHGAPAGVYNTVGGNLGIGRALRDNGLDKSVVFIGHELNANTRLLLEGGAMDFVIGHDVYEEVAQSARALSVLLEGKAFPQIEQVPVRIYAKYNCS